MIYKAPSLLHLEPNWNGSKETQEQESEVTQEQEPEQPAADHQRKTPAPNLGGKESLKGMERSRKGLTECSQQEITKKTPREPKTTSINQTDREQDKSDRPVCQQTLTELHSLEWRDMEGLEGRTGISIHGPSCQGPRVLLKVTGDTQETQAKVSCLADDSETYYT